MAVGVSGMFGFSCPENFEYPYLTKSFAGFWKRWHISLSSWFRDYVYIPLGGSRTKKKYRTYLNLLIVWLLTGLWHGNGWQFVAWGLGWYICIAIERCSGISKAQSRVLTILYRIFVLAIVNILWVVFSSSDMKSGINFIRTMFAFDGMFSRRAWLQIKGEWLFILLSVVSCFPVKEKIKKLISMSKCGLTAYSILYMLILAFLFVLAVGLLMINGNNPFAYEIF